MKKLTFLLLFCLPTAFAQQASMPEIPKKIDFAGVTIKLDAAAQDLVKREVNSLLLPQNKYLTDKLERMQWFFPIIEDILEKEGVPDDFKYLAVSESSLIADAISPSNAVGFWQMKQPTAEELGLQVDDQIDERKNIFASTRAATNYLKRSNQIYKNWISSLYSYSLGAAGISKIVPTNWASANEISFDGKTDRYLIKAIANRIAYEYRLNRLQDSPNLIVEYKNAKGKNLDEIASELGVDFATLKKHNSWLKSLSVPTNKNYSVAVLIPQENLESIQSKLRKSSDAVVVESSDGIFPILKKITQNASEDEPTFYEINNKKGILAKAGDDVASLARQSKTSIKNFLRYNDMNPQDMVSEGKVYYLKKKNRKAQIPHHVVTENQNLWEISQMYGVRMKNLLKYNRLKEIQRVPKGRVVWLQSKRPKNQPIEIMEKEETEQSPVVVEKKTLPTRDKRKPIPTETPKVENTTKTDSDDDIVVLTEEPKKAEEPAPVLQPKKETPRVIETTQEVPKTIEKPIYEAPKPKVTTAGNVHIVEQGQTLYSVARQYNVSVKELAAWNGFTTDEKVKVGQQIIVRNPSTTASKPSSPKPTNSSTTHEVQKGETLFSIAKRYGVTMTQIQTWNNMTDANVKIGQKLLIKK